MYCHSENITLDIYFLWHDMRRSHRMFGFFRRKKKRNTFLRLTKIRKLVVFINLIRLWRCHAIARQERKKRLNHCYSSGSTTFNKKFNFSRQKNHYKLLISIQWQTVDKKYKTFDFHRNEEEKKTVWSNWSYSIHESVYFMIFQG